jgi:hypothetical protein
MTTRPTGVTTGREDPEASHVVIQPDGSTERTASVFRFEDGPVTVEYGRPLRIAPGAALMCSRKEGITLRTLVVRTEPGDEEVLRRQDLKPNPRAQDDTRERNAPPRRV